MTNSKGQTLLEMAIALSAILLTLAAIAIAIVTSVNNSQFIKSQSQASKYAQQGMEVIRYMRNNNILSFNSYSGTNCMDSNNTISVDTGNCGGVNIGGSFIRQVDFSKLSTDCSFGTLIRVTVKWSSTKCDASTIESRFCHKSELVSCFREQADIVTP